MALSAGSSIGSYEVTALIGQGGMGEVYRARDIRLGRGSVMRALLIIIALGTTTSAWSQSIAPPVADRCLIIVIDGLRPDYVTPTVMPTLAALRDGGFSGENHHAVVPTVTRVNASSIATGSYPRTHGMLGNSLYVPRVRLACPPRVAGSREHGRAGSVRGSEWGPRPFRGPCHDPAVHRGDGVDGWPLSRDASEIVRGWHRLRRLHRGHADLTDTTSRRVRQVCHQVEPDALRERLAKKNSEDFQHDRLYDTVWAVNPCVASP